LSRGLDAALNGKQTTPAAEVASTEVLENLGVVVQSLLKVKVDREAGGLQLLYGVWVYVHAVVAVVL
jgi:hypothetical protein